MKRSVLILAGVAAVVAVLVIVRAARRAAPAKVAAAMDPYSNGKPAAVAGQPAPRLSIDVDTGEPVLKPE